MEPCPLCGQQCTVTSGLDNGTNFVCWDCLVSFSASRHGRKILPFEGSVMSAVTYMPPRRDETEDYIEGYEEGYEAGFDAGKDAA